ncbi:hypothetical protein SeLEV6574_g02296 [Synchytrium endobioticum]|uniref:Peroxisomal ATPase PEX1 n=1 Tax=Synchytrium endobioticum TaxID=286115 RepID=A0A507D8T3_9FUNG|nr:hypothetical protein SeLEV6574_g02296 [Synchytrium endobioticum]
MAIELLTDDASAVQAPFPVSTRQASRQLSDGHPAEIVLSEFADKILLLVTELGKLGSLFLATLDAPPSTAEAGCGGADHGRSSGNAAGRILPPTTVRTLLGSREDAAVTSRYCRVEMNKSNTLTVAFGNVMTCFVNLPPSWVSALSDQPKALRAGGVVLELSWMVNSELGPTKRTVFVGWAGGSSSNAATSPNGNNKNAFSEVASVNSNNTNVMEIETAFGQGLGLMPGQRVNVEFVKNVETGISVDVEPLTEDDWEILELHAGYLEEQMLNQVRIVHAQEIIAVWIHQRTLIRLRVLSTNPPAKCVRLDIDAEVIVAPKQRRSHLAPVHAPAQQLNPSSQPKQCTPLLRLIPKSYLTALQAAFDDENTVHIHPSSVPPAAQLADGTIVRVVRRELKNPGQEPRDEQNDKDSPPPAMLRTVFAALRHSALVPPGHLGVGQDVIEGLKLPPFARIKVVSAAKHSLTKCKLLVQKVVKSAVPTTVVLNQKHAEKGERIIETVKSWMTRRTRHHSLVLTDGCVLRFPLLLNQPQSDRYLRLLIRLIPSGMKQEVALASAVGENYVVIENEQAAQSIIVDEGKDTQVGIVPADWDLEEHCPRLGGVDDLLKSIAQHVKSSLSRRSLRKKLNAPALGGLLIHGAPGSGRTRLIDVVAYQLGRSTDTLAHTHVVQCSEMVSDAVPKIKKTIRNAFDLAAWRSPSLLVFEDMERLMPMEREHTDSNHKTIQLSEFFSDVCQYYRTRHTIYVIATATAATALHPSLLSSHTLAETILVPSPSRNGRKQILEALLEAGGDITRQALETGAIDVAVIAGSTEGYLPADLKVLVERAVYQCAMRSVKSKQAWINLLMNGDVNGVVDASSMSEPGLVQVDFTQAQGGHVPSSLRGLNLQTSEVSWNDIGGLYETKRVLLETLEWPTKYAPIFANSPLRLRSGLLLYGFPGCGKTLLASAVAKECGLNFISVKGPELLNKYIGASEQAVRDLFTRAQAARPCVLFFDEFDAIAPRRGHDNTGVTDRVVNQILTQMDGAEGLEGVYVLGATSRPDIIDPALLRPGRLDKSLLCGMPGVEERKDILKAVARKLVVDASVDFHDLAVKSEGMSGADLQAMLYNAHLEAVHEMIDEQERQREEAMAGHCTDANGHAINKEVKNSLQNSNSDADGPRVEFVIAELKNDGNNSNFAVRMTAAERGLLAQRIETIHKDYADRLSRLYPDPANGKGGASSKATAKHNPHLTTIKTNHVVSALSQTRPSLSSEEGAKLQRVYDEFVSGRGAPIQVGNKATLA